MRKLLPAFFVLMFAYPSLAQSGSWAALSRLKEGQKIQITETNSKTHTGVFQSVSDSSLVLTEGSSQKSFQRSEIRSVKLKTNRRLRNTLIGAGVGGATGAILGAATTPSDGWFGGKGIAAAFVGTGFAFLGGAVGVVWPTHNTVFKAPSH